MDDLDEYFVMQKGDAVIEGVHALVVKAHEAIGYKVTGPYVSPAQQEDGGESSPLDSPERAAALKRFAQTLETARKKPTDPIAKRFEQMGIVIADPPGEAEPWPPHVLMAQVIDALAQEPASIQKNVVLVELFGKSGSYINELVSERMQSLAGEQ